jgi:hypothetical protein
VALHFERFRRIVDEENLRRFVAERHGTSAWGGERSSEMASSL